MKFVIVQITNENDTLEADISASDSGLRPSKPSYHLMLDRPDGATYASVRAIRQPRPGDWAAVVSSLIGRLP